MLNTEFEIQTFRRLLDVNWEISELEEKLTAVKIEMSKLETDLKESMGEDNWSVFMQMGREMMSNKKGVEA